MLAILHVRLGGAGRSVPPKSIYPQLSVGGKFRLVASHIDDDVDDVTISIAQISI